MNEQVNSVNQIDGCCTRNVHDPRQKKWTTVLCKQRENRLDVYPPFQHNQCSVFTFHFFFPALDVCVFTLARPYKRKKVETNPIADNVTTQIFRIFSTFCLFNQKKM